MHARSLLLLAVLIGLTAGCGSQAPAEVADRAVKGSAAPARPAELATPPAAEPVFDETVQLAQAETDLFSPAQDPQPADHPQPNDGPARRAAQTREGNPRLPHCLVLLKDEARVPAEEPGKLLELPAEAGQQVAKGDLLGRIDDIERRMQREVALIEQKKAKEQAENDINVRYAVAAAGVAEAEYQQAIDANRRVAGTYPSAEVRRLQLTWQRAQLQIEQSQLEQLLASFDVKVRGAEVEAAENNIRRRQITAPFDGTVVEVFKHAGEWVQPGDVVLRVVNFETLRIEGYLNASDYDPGEIAGKPITVEVERARGRRVELPGRIVYVSELFETGGAYAVRAEVTNRREQGQWLLSPGLKAAMVIELR